MLQNIGCMLAVALMLCVSGCTTTRSSLEDSFSFALIGDMPYYPRDVARFERLVEDVNADDDINWILHVGDIKRGDQPCSDEFLAGRLALYQKFEQPFIFIPGDNEWTDCHREGAGQYQPLERLEKLRELFYPVPGQSLGMNPMTLETQAKEATYIEFPEHVRWMKENVMFVGLHILGSQNGLAPFAGRSQQDDDEVQRRTDAAIQWMREAFSIARENQSPGLFLMIHANPGFTNAPEFQAFQSFLSALENETVRFGKPVLLAHGDSHYFRIDKPLMNSVSKRRVANFTRVETFGAGDVHWLRVIVDPKDKNVFSIRQELMPEMQRRN